MRDSSVCDRARGRDRGAAHPRRAGEEAAQFLAIQVRSVVRVLSRLLELTKRANRGVLVALYVLIIAVCFAAVIFRYVLNDSLTWAEEFGRYLFIALVFLGGAYVVLEDGHLRMDVLYTSVPRPIRRAVDGITVGCALFFLVSSLGAVWTGLGIVGNQRWSSLPLPMQLAYLPMLIGIALGLIYLVHLAVRGKTVSESPTENGAASSGRDEVPRA